MRILLINISKNWGRRVYIEYPLGLGLIGTILKRNGHDVKIHDTHAASHDVKSLIESFRPDIVGISFLSTSAYTAFQTIAELRRIKNFHLIAGGLHSSFYYEEVLKAGVDVVVIGEAEHVIVPLTDALNRAQSRDFYDKSLFSGIKNVAFKNKEHMICVNDRAPYDGDLDALPFLDRDLYDLEKYAHHSMISSRGCRHHCRFCSSQRLLRGTPQSFSIKRIVDEIEFIHARYGNVKLYWADDMFFYNHKERMAFCDELTKRNISMEYSVQLRADDVNAELVDALKATGCSKIAIGAESGSDEILRTIRKGITTEQIENAIHLARTRNLRIKTWWIVGLPGKFEEQLKSLDLIEKTRPNEVAVHSFVPLPGSWFWNKHKDFSIVLPQNLEQLENSYYSLPEGDSFSYFSSSQLRDLINRYENTLKTWGYLSTDSSDPEDEFIYTTPNQKATFEV